MFWAALFGLFVASYLLYVYTSGADLRCGPLHGCDIVRASSFSSWFGVPTPAFGVAFYLAVLALLVFRAYAPHIRPKQLRLFQILFVCAGFAESLFLTGVQRFALHAFCTWCLCSAAAATIIFALAWFDRPIELGLDRAARELKIIFVSIVIFIFAGGASSYWLTRPVEIRAITPIMQQQTPEKLLVPNGSTTTTTERLGESATADPQVVTKFTPVEGSATSKVTLVEFLDFQCPACGLYQKLVMLPLRVKYAGRVRFAQRQFPLADVHPFAVGAAVAGICAHQQGKYFAYSDMLYANQAHLEKNDLLSYADKIGLNAKQFTSCLDDPAALKLVLQDRDAGLGFGVQGTPTLILNDAIIEGTPNLETMSKLIDERLK